MDTENRIRRKGAGRKPSIEIIENIDEVFLKVIDDYIAGDPMDEKIRWTNLSQKQIAEKMQQQGIGISVTVVKKLLKRHGFTERVGRRRCRLGPEYAWSLLSADDFPALISLKTYVFEAIVVTRVILNRVGN